MTTKQRPPKTPYTAITEWLVASAPSDPSTPDGQTNEQFVMDEVERSRRKGRLNACFLREGPWIIALNSPSID